MKTSKQVEVHSLYSLACQLPSWWYSNSICPCNKYFWSPFSQYQNWYL